MRRYVVLCGIGGLGGIERGVGANDGCVVGCGDCRRGRDCEGYDG
jgi:hypothetical protein